MPVLEPIHSAQPWKSHAACTGLDSAIFYPPEEADDGDPDVRAAKEVCGICPVQELCLEFALASREKEGVWGGYTARERRRIIRRRRRSA